MAEGNNYDTRMKGKIGTTLQYDHRAARNHHVCAIWDPDGGGRWVAAVDFVGYSWQPKGFIPLPGQAMESKRITAKART